MTQTNQASADAFSAKIRENAELVENWIQAKLTAMTDAKVPPRTRDAMRHGLLAGGKRFRPFLVIETAKLFDIPAEQSIPTAAALECIHAYSLIHDDLPAMDDDDIRRGQPTVHKAFDEATAILAGDALLTLAFEILAAPETHEDPSIRIKLVAALAKAAGVAGMVGGQQLDLEAETQDTHTLAQIERIQSMKTGALIRYACEAGGLLGQANPTQTAALTTYATNIGLAFQLADDLLDAEGDAEKVGKATGKDADAGKATFVDVLGAQETRARMTTLVDEAANALCQFSEKSDMLIAAARFTITRDH